MNNILSILEYGFWQKINTDVAYENAKKTKECPVCGLALMEKGDWIFCPKNSQEIPTCDSPYHMAHNFKTGQGFCVVIK